jgi:hypothetical protein
MADVKMQRCPQCGEQTPSPAKTCSHCGVQLGRYRPGSPYTDPGRVKRPAKPKKSPGLFLVILLIGLLLAALSAWGLMQLKFGRINPATCIVGIVAGAVISIFGLKGLFFRG